jgi:hypothetical protein
VCSAEAVKDFPGERPHLQQEAEASERDPIPVIENGLQTRCGGESSPEEETALSAQAATLESIKLIFSLLLNVFEKLDAAAARAVLGGQLLPPRVSIIGARFRRDPRVTHQRSYFLHLRTQC